VEEVAERMMMIVGAGRSGKDGGLPPPAWRTRLRRSLLAWYRRNARDLPWRGDRDPYRVWLSEIMLQQTRVDTVGSYFERFVARFPTISELARASEDEVLSAWQGLGYYRRARQLRAAARILVERHGGRFPDRLQSVLALPGIGRYTAGAILSIARDQAHPAVDGNTTRVVSRLLVLDGSEADRRARVWEVARVLVPRRYPGDWNQALMELGALVCTPRNPLCLECPVSELCAARAAGRERMIPPPRRRPVPPSVEVAAAFIHRRGGGLAMVRRPDTGVLGGFYELPAVEVPPGREPRAHLASALTSLGARGVEVGDVLGRAEHTRFDQRARITAYAARAARRDKGAMVEIEGADLVRYPVTTATRKILAAIRSRAVRSRAVRSRALRESPGRGQE
jgi:A/G-specific adenine glycosylase